MENNPLLDPDYLAYLESKNAPKEPVAPTPTPQEFADMIAKGVADALAARDAETAKKTVAVATDASFGATVTSEPTVDTDGPLYGNKDDKQQFDLRKMTTLRELPKDKVVVAFPKFNTDSAGNKIGLDLKNTQIQFFDPQAHTDRAKTDKTTGSNIYQLLAMDVVLLHEPA